MSWAALAQKYKGQTVQFSEPKQVVYATDASLTEKQAQLLNTKHETIGDVSLPQYSKGLLVLDANAIFNALDKLNNIADAYVTVPQVIKEIRDSASREMVEKLPHQLLVLDPTKEALKKVIDVAEKTGDLGVVSRTDIRLCALALDCCQSAGCLGTQIEPRAIKINDSDAGVTTVADEVEISEEEEDEEECEGEEEAGEEKQEQQEAEEEGEEKQKKPIAAPSLPGWGADDGDADDDGGEWITPENIQDVTAKYGACEAFEGGVACVTSDFAMQNVLMHVGVPIVGTNGLQIRELRQWLLRCFACFEVVTDTTRQFCPACGSGDTLRRVSYTINSDGEKKLFINFRYKISTRGAVYNLPRPRGGKRGTNKTLILREDLLAHVVRGTSAASQVKKKLMQDADDDEELAMFGLPPKQKKKDLSQPRVTSSYHRYNVNEWKKARASRKK